MCARVLTTIISVFLHTLLTTHHNLAIVSCMHRSYHQNDECRSRMSNVYFLCNIRCIKMLQPPFLPILVVIPIEIRLLLLLVHYQLFSLGISFLFFCPTNQFGLLQARKLSGISCTLILTNDYTSFVIKVSCYKKCYNKSLFI